jgi:uncharacterized membrane protein
MKTIYQIYFYTMSDGKTYIHVYADTSAEAIKIAEQNSDFCQLMDYSIVTESEIIRIYGERYLNKIKGNQ